MKYLPTMYAFTKAMPNAVISVTARMPSIGPSTLTTSSTSRMPQIFT